MTRAATAALLGLALAVAAAGCFDDRTDSPTLQSNLATPIALPAQKKDRGCSNEQPYHYEVPDASWDALVHTCRSKFWNSKLIRNESDLALDVWASGTAAPELSVYSPSGLSAWDRIVESSTRAGWSPFQGIYVLTPGSTAVGTSYAPFILNFKIDRPRTVVAGSASVLVGALKAKLTSPGRRLGEQIVACAQNTRESLSGSPYWQDWVSNAANEILQCGGLLKRAFNYFKEAPPPSAVQTIWSRFRALSGAKYIDALQYLIGTFRRA
jgi:hypothetical protein